MARDLEQLVAALDRFLGDHVAARNRLREALRADDDRITPEELEHLKEMAQRDARRIMAARPEGDMRPLESVPLKRRKPR